MQQGDQARAAVDQTECPLQPGPDLADAARAAGVDPIAQSGGLLIGQAAACAFMAKALQRFDPAAFKSPELSRHSWTAQRTEIVRHKRREPAVDGFASAHAQGTKRGINRFPAFPCFRMIARHETVTCDEGNHLLFIVL
jgi:hypothetical protein